MFFDRLPYMSDVGQLYSIYSNLLFKMKFALCMAYNLV